MAVALNCQAVASSNDEQPTIARWYENKRSAISLRFDDSRTSHVEIVIPLLNSHNIPATFMINPGVAEYSKYRTFWEKEVPKMIHRIGNHTMHHKGAKNIESADSEIGEVSKLIWQLYPNETPLTVFASGGGVKWGGERWENADPSYKQLVKKYHLIDLYDGFHKSKPYNSDDTPEDYCRLIKEAIDSGKHRAFHFHQVGEPDLKDKMFKLLNGVSLNAESETFASIIECVSQNRRFVWVAPLIDILKYETQYRASKLTINKDTSSELELSLKVDTDIKLYDQELTLIVSRKNGHKPKSIYQDGKPIQMSSAAQDGKWYVDVRPINSTVSIHFQ